MKQLILNFVKNIVPGIFANFCYDKVKSRFDNFTEQNSIVQNFISIENPINEPEFQEYAERLNNFLDILNRDGKDAISISKLSQIIREDSSEKTVRIFKGIVMADNDFLTKLHTIFNFNIDYFNGISENIFDINHPFEFIIEHYFNTITKNNVKKVYFIKDETGNVLIFVKHSDWNYKILCDNVFVTSDVGATGLSKMHSLAKLIEKIKNIHIDCVSYIVTNSELDLIRCGKIFLGKFDTAKIYSSQWADDFCDRGYFINNKNIYLEKYGKDFVKALELIYP